ncbi:MAG TPA: DUF359 domain-containing protein [Candidatus Bathyarchaeia archaeon]|nr:DUF359 domain-containing protein [Candidatus Bathyarchaeia archaeon]
MEHFQFNDHILKLILPVELRSEMKEPMGELITINPTKELIERIRKQNPPLVVLVGDYCVKDAIKNGLIPDISIIDGKNLRKSFKKISINNAKVIKRKNPPATITIKTWQTIKELVSEQLAQQLTNKSKEPIVLLIDGEEDLLVLPITLEAPEKSFIVYGQPHEGIVIINVTANVKLKFTKLIERMQVERNEN